MMSSSFQLTPPEPVTPLTDDAQAPQAVPLTPSTQAAVEAQVQNFVASLLSDDLQSEAFKARLDSAFALGREEVSLTASLLQGRFLQCNFVGVEDGAAFTAIQAMRTQLDALNPGKEGDLLQKHKLLGFIPYGSKLQNYFRKFQAAATQLQTCLQQIYAARDDMQRDGVELDVTRSKLWEAMQKLRAAILFAQLLDTQLSQQVQGLRLRDPARAQAIEQEVLFYTRQNLQDILTQLAVCTNGYLALEVLKKSAREVINGCSRVATTGMSALAVAQTVARATGNQIKVMDMLEGVNASIGNLIAESGRQLKQHVDKTTEFASKPLVGIEQMQEMFEQTFQAMDAMDAFRSQAIEVMGKNNEMVKAQLTLAERYIDRMRQAPARDAQHALAGPVAL